MRMGVHERPLFVGFGALFVVFAITGCGAGQKEEGIEIPDGYEFDDMFMSGVFVHEPARGGECSSSTRGDCWETTFTDNGTCRGDRVHLTFREENASGGRLAKEYWREFQLEPDGDSYATWSSQWFRDDVIDRIRVVTAVCAG